MDFSSVQVVRPYEQIVKQIQHAIREGQIAPGERLPTERELAEQFGVSRSVVREAIKVLGTMGLVESRQGSGSYVQNSTIQTISRAFVLSVSPDAESVERLFEFRQVLETEAAHLAAIRATPDQISAIEVTLARMNHSEELDPWKLFAEVDPPFHILISEACGNPYLQVAIACVRDMQQDVVRIFSERAGSVEDAMKHHHLILEAIRQHDPAAAAASMAEHIRYTASVVQRHIPQEDRL
jgi:GntR family transcriptional regulator, transcriptional repressor for pyruvate dehydrogenase complex